MVSQDEKLYWWKCDGCSDRLERVEFGMPLGWVYIQPSEGMTWVEHYCPSCAKERLTESQRIKGAHTERGAILAGVKRRSIKRTDLMPGSPEAKQAEARQLNKDRLAECLEFQLMATSTIYRKSQSKEKQAAYRPRGGYPTPKAPAPDTPAERARRAASLEEMRRDYDATVAMFKTKSGAPTKPAAPAAGEGKAP